MVIYEWCNNFILRELSYLGFPLAIMFFKKKKKSLTNVCHMYACIYILHKKYLLTQDHDIVSVSFFLVVAI
jgi:hypothetical protein